jgi:hypothetical protein
LLKTTAIVVAAVLSLLAGSTRAADAPDAGATPGPSVVPVPPSAAEEVPPPPPSMQSAPASPNSETPAAAAVGPAIPLAAPVPPKPPAPPSTVTHEPETPAPPPLPADELADPGYVPGYRTYQGLSLGPSVPRVGALPGGVTPGYAAPMPPAHWTFRFSGFLNDTFQSSIGTRMVTMPGQTSTIFHIQPQVVDEYASFLGTSTAPGQWVALNFAYGTPIVTANLNLTTWNPTDPTTYYQIGSQNFIGNAFLQFDVTPVENLKTRTLAGYFFTSYGGLGQYGLGMYTNPLIGLIRGVGEDVAVEYRLTPTVSLLFEEGFMGNRNGKAPNGILPDNANGGMQQANPSLPADWIAHAHIGLIRTGAPTFKAQLHFIRNWSQDDQVQCQNASSIPNAPGDGLCLDNPTTREINEAYIPDGHINVIGADASLNSSTWGYVGLAGSYTSAVDAFPLRGLATFGGEGQPLTQRWWGNATGGSGSLYAAGINYSVSVGRLLSGPLPFRSDAPDLVLNAGFIVAYTTTNANALSGASTPGPLNSDVDQDNHRRRYKFAVDGLYTMRPWMAAGLRVDHVIPSSKDGTQTFSVLAPRLVFRTNWMARESITLLYAKWFYGSNTHPEASSIIAPDGRLDDQLIALNVNIWW